MNYITFLTLLFLQLAYITPRKWNYQKQGPDTWLSTYPVCNGSRQSPVNIETSNVWFDTNLHNFDMVGYESVPRNAHWKIMNSGHSVQLLVNGEYKLVDGNLPGTYKIAYLEYRWGETDTSGSEHTIDGHAGAMELQMYHYDTQYGSYDQAVKEPNGIAVLSFIIQKGQVTSPAYNLLIKELHKIKKKGEDEAIRPFSLMSLMSQNLQHYYRYEGSFTTPPCTENVIWTVFKEPIKLTEKQIASFRKSITLHREDESDDDEDDEDKEDPKERRKRTPHVYIKYNVRPIQPLKRRTVYSSNPEDANIFSSPLSSPLSMTFAVAAGFLLLLVLTR